MVVLNLQYPRRPRHVELVRLIAANVRDRPSSDDTPDGISMRSLLEQARSKLIAQNQDALKSFMVELLTHDLCKQKMHEGVTYVTMPSSYVESILAFRS